MSTLDDLQAAGFSEGEVKDFAAQQRQTLSAAGFTDDEINQHLGVPAQPDTLAANKQFSRVVGDALTKAAATLKPAGETVMDVASVYAPIEAALNAGSGLLFGFPAYVGAGLGGLVSKHLLGLDADPKELAENMARVFTYQPMTQRGQRLAGNVMLPLTMLQEGSEAAGHGVTTLATKAGASTNTAAALGAVTDSTIQMLTPTLLGELGRKMGGQTVTADDMRNTAQVIAGPEATHEVVQAVEQGLQSTYRKTGIGPYTVLEDAHKDPQIAADLADPQLEVPRAYEEHVETPKPDAKIDPKIAAFVDDDANVNPEARAYTMPTVEAVHEAQKLIGPEQFERLAAERVGRVSPGETWNAAQAAQIEMAARGVVDFYEQNPDHSRTGPSPGDGVPLLDVSGQGITELNAGLNPAASIRAIRDSYTPFVGVESPNAPGKAPPAVGGETPPGPRSPLVDSLQKIFAPASRGELAQAQANIMRANFGEMAREREVALTKMKDFAADFDKMPVEDNIRFIDAMERGTQLQDPKLAEAATALRELLDSRRDQVQALGKGQLENFDENYFPHMWKDADAATALFSRRPLEGSKSFLKARTIPLTTDGLRWRAYDAEGDFIKSFETEAQAKAAAGPDGRVGAPLKPITTNPVEMALLKAREMDKYIYGQKIFAEMKDADLARFVRFGERPLPGWTKIDDKIARVWSPADVDIHEAYDARIMGKLQQFAKDIGVKVSRSVKVGTGAEGAKTWGWADRSGRVATRFGGPETVLTHELGHQLDFKYGLEKEFVNDPATKEELRKLADLRFEGQAQVPQSFKNYVRKGTEKMANMVHAYVHMPERFKQVAPNTYAKFEAFLDEHPELSGLREIKPSLTLGSNKATVNAGGMILRGECYAPDEAATLINNHLSPGLQGNGFYDAWRGVGNAVNALQLGLSAFHVGFTTMDSMISRAALGVKQISRGDVLQGIGNVGQGLNPAQPFINIYKGDKLLRAYLGELDSPDLAPIVDAIQQAGGRVKMDDFYRNAQVNAFKQALRAEDYAGAAKAFLPTVLDRIGAPIFEWLVPRQKLGVFFDMAKDWLAENPKADVAAKREGLGKLWDSVDNRMGQLVYDNVFWNRALKDGLMATVRSVGWNLGTFRELGGGVLDVKNIGRDKGFSDRTAYVVALPLITGIYGAIMNYAYTGEAPQSLKDVFYPRTGKLRPDGSEDRVSLPTYMKDVFAYGEDAHNFAAYGGDPTQTIKNKLHPLIAMVSQMLNNKDFFGGAIRNPADKAVEQIADEVAFLIQQIEPFSYRNYIQQAKAKGEEPTVMGYLTSPSMIGITPAPGYITKSPEELESSHVSQMHDSLVQKFKEQIKGGKDPEELIPEMLKSGMSKRDVKYIISSSGDVPKPHKLKKFGGADE
jgi:hypothetical protein